MQTTASGTAHRACRLNRLIGFLGTASFAALASTAGAQPQPADTIEEITVTGTIIRGTQAVGVPITSLGSQDFKDSGALTVGDLMRTIPGISLVIQEVASAPGRAGERGNRTNIHGRQLGDARSMLMVNSLRNPPQNIGGNSLDPAIIPEIAVDHVEVLTDGASSLYGSDAVAGVINIILKRNFDGAVTQARFGTAIGSFGGGMTRYQVGQLYGRTWEGGDVTLAYEFSEQGALKTTADRLEFQQTFDFRPWGLDNRTNIASARPGVVSTGAPDAPNFLLGSLSCTNCYSIPHGTGWDFGTRAPGPTTSWTTLLANKGVLNQVNPYSLSDLTSRTQRNAVVLTFDQRILDHAIFGGAIKGATLFVDAFYNNRRTIYFGTTQTSPGRNNQRTFQVPTNNPYYPTGAPANIRVSYSLADELNARLTPAEQAKRWSGGVNFELPAEWLGKIFYSVTESHTVFNQENIANTNMLDAAIGRTIASIPASGSTPGQAAYTKPANVPFLNVFCDSTVFHCNSQTTLDYVSGSRRSFALYQLKQWGAQFDGPLLELPGGETRAAFGLHLLSWNYNADDQNNTGTHSKAIVATAPSIFARQIPAAFVELNVPIFGDSNAVPLIQRLELQGAYRVDHYYDAGLIKSPKLAAEWTPGWGLKLRASWGRSFKAPNQTELTASSARVQPVNMRGGDPTDTLRACPVGSTTPTPGSAGEKLVKLGLASCTGVGAPLFPGGINAAAAAWPGVASIIRPQFGTGPENLEPETATNTSFGAVFDPDLLPGFHAEATYWRVKIKDLLAAFGTSQGVNLTDPLWTTFIITPDNTGGNFGVAAHAMITNSTSSVPVADVNEANLTFIIDGLIRNIGFLLVDGYDFNTRYDWDAGDLGAFTVGVTGTYYHQSILSLPGAPPKDFFHFDLANDKGVSTEPRLRLRARLGWTDGTWSFNAFLTHIGHYNHQQAVTDASALFPNYTNIVPAIDVLDLSAGYNTGDMPANTYLKNISVQLTVNDVLDKRSPFSYITGGNPAAFDVENGASPVGRYVTVFVTKTW